MKLVNAEIIMAYEKGLPFGDYLLRSLGIYCLRILGIKAITKTKSDANKAKQIMLKIWENTDQITFGYSSECLSINKTASGDLTATNYNELLSKNIYNPNTIVVHCYPDFIYLTKNGYLKIGKKAHS